jgi:hypothetical protein
LPEQKLKQSVAGEKGVEKERIVPQPAFRHEWFV